MVTLALIAIFYFIVTSSLFSVTEFGVTLPRKDFGLTESDIRNCVLEYRGKNVFSVNTSEVTEKVKKCSPFVSSALVTKILPSTLEITVEEIQPVVKFKSLESCYLVEESLAIHSFPIEQCSLTILPEISGDIAVDNIILLNAVISIDRELLSLNEEKPQTYKVSFNSDVYFIEAVYSDYTTLSLPSLPVETYITRLLNARNGLRDRGEPFSQIDLRFDRVIVR